MAKIKLDVVTAERPVFSDEADFVVAPGSMGELGILPKHAPLLTTLEVGEIRVRKDGEEYAIFTSGGFMEVLPDRITILANTAERAEDIDEARALEARERAETLMASKTTAVEMATAEAALRRAAIRLKIARRKHGGAAGPHGE
ncbi:MAG: F0F1 ATP synthase subunit epsilon [Nitrospirae bacterium]|nr:F0F1 ATP synthase subunit epsilon [Nitrospirota bacterium]